MNVKDSKNISRTDWESLENMSDEDIDYSDIPPLGDRLIRKCYAIAPPHRHKLTVLTNSVY